MKRACVLFLVPRHRAAARVDTRLGPSRPSPNPSRSRGQSRDREVASMFSLVLPLGEHLSLFASFA